MIHGRDRTRAEAVATAIRNGAGRADLALGSLSDNAGADAVAKAALAGGAIDILINNAGAYENLSWCEATPDKWLETIQSDALSSVRMIQRFVPAMRTRGWGRMIQVGSGTGSQPFAGYPQYCATKAMTHNLAVSLARELKNSGVTSNIVSPGLIKVKSVEDWFTRMAPDRGGETISPRSRRVSSATSCPTTSDGSARPTKWRQPSCSSPAHSPPTFRAPRRSDIASPNVTPCDASSA